MGSRPRCKLGMVHLRTVPDPWQARVLAARLGAEGILTELRGNLSGPYPFGPVQVLVEAEKHDLAAQLLLFDEVEAALSFQAPEAVPGGAGADWGTAAHQGTEGTSPRHRSAARRLAAAAAALVIASTPLLAHLIGQ
ncbi:MAG: hypothetical protein ACP5VR_03450 [Acidimicrobiales bacterium]